MKPKLFLWNFLKFKRDFVSIILQKNLATRNDFEKIEQSFSLISRNGISNFLSFIWDLIKFKQESKAFKDKKSQVCQSHKIKLSLNFVDPKQIS